MGYVDHKHGINNNHCCQASVLVLGYFGCTFSAILVQPPCLALAIFAPGRAHTGRSVRRIQMRQLDGLLRGYRHQIILLKV